MQGYSGDNALAMRDEHSRSKGAIVAHSKVIDVTRLEKLKSGSEINFFRQAPTGD